MKTIMKNILLLSLALVSVEMQDLNGNVRSRTASTPQYSTATSPKDIKIENVEKATQEYTNLINKTKYAADYDILGARYGSTDTKENRLSNTSLSKKAQIILYTNLNAVLPLIEAKLLAEAKLVEKTDAVAQKTLYEKYIKKALKLLHNIAFNQNEWKELNQNIGLLRNCVQKDKDENDDFQSRTDRKIANQDSHDFSVKAGLSELDESPSESFLKAFLTNFEEWKTIEQNLSLKKLTQDEMKRLIVDPIYDSVVRSIYAKKTKDVEKTKANVNTPDKLRKYLKDKQKYHKMLLEFSLDYKIELFNQYKAIGFNDEIKESKLKNMLCKVGIPGVILAMIGIFVYCGETDNLPKIKIPLGEQEDQKNVQDHYTSFSEIIKGFFNPAEDKESEEDEESEEDK